MTEIVISLLLIVVAAISLYSYHSGEQSKIKVAKYELDAQEQRLKLLQQDAEANISAAKLRAEQEYERILAAQRDNYHRLEKELESAYNTQKQKNLEDLSQQILEISDKVNSFKNDRLKAIENEVLDFQKKRISQIISQVDKDIAEIRETTQQQINKLRQDSALTQQEIENNLATLRRQENAAIEARIRQYEELNKTDFYRIILSPSDINEIEELQEVMVKLRNPTPLKKAIFDYYYKSPINDLINRITEGRRISGIYKITNISTGQCYIGQSVDIGARWMQHCKRGAGVDERTQLKLYVAMDDAGLHNFTFEIIEETLESELSKQEKYWSEYFGAKVFGYSIKN